MARHESELAEEPNKNPDQTLLVMTGTREGWHKQNYETRSSPAHLQVSAATAKAPVASTARHGLASLDDHLSNLASVGAGRRAILGTEVEGYLRCGGGPQQRVEGEADGLEVVQNALACVKLSERLVTKQNDILYTPINCSVSASSHTAGVVVVELQTPGDLILDTGTGILQG